MLHLKFLNAPSPLEDQGSRMLIWSVMRSSNWFLPLTLPLYPTEIWIQMEEPVRAMGDPKYLHSQRCWFPSGCWSNLYGNLNNIEYTSSSQPPSPGPLPDPSFPSPRPLATCRFLNLNHTVPQGLQSPWEPSAFMVPPNFLWCPPTCWKASSPPQCFPMPHLETSPTYRITKSAAESHNPLPKPMQST